MKSTDYSGAKKMSTTMRIFTGFMLTVVFAIIGIIAVKVTNASAGAGSISVVSINYEESTITLKGNAKDTKIFFSDSKAKVWDEVYGELGSDKTVTMDMSWISSSSDYTIKFKGNVSTDIVTVVIPKQETRFKATYNRVKQVVYYTNKGSRDVQWRKKDSYAWNTVPSNFADILDKLSMQGTTVYLRLASIEGKSATDPGARPSKEVSINIAKKATAPTITINGSKFVIPVSKNMGYRIYTEDSDNEWTNVTVASELPLSKIAGGVLYSTLARTQHEVTLQFRTNATSTTAASHITTVIVPIQEGPPDEDKYGISHTYTSSSSLELVVKAASTAQPFEYTIIKKGDVLDYQTAVWTPITSSSKITITNSKAEEGSHIYVRKKSVAATSTVDFALASKELDITGSTGVNYPTTASTKALTKLITTAGVVNADNTLIFTLYSPTKTTVTSINLKDSYGNAKGSITSLKSSVMANTDAAAGENEKYIITTKITSTASIDSITEEELYATMILENADEFVSTTSTGICIYLYPATKVNNEDYKKYTNEFERVYGSTDSNDDSDFSFNLDFGKQYVFDEKEVGKFKEDLVQVSKMIYDGRVLDQSKGEFSVEYGTKSDTHGDIIRTAQVKINVNKFESDSIITVRNTKEPLVIELNNGETLENAVTINLIETASIVEAPVAYSITEGSLEETKTETITNSDGSTTSVTKDVTTFTIKLKLFDTKYDVGISDVTWNNQSIMKSAEISGGVATIYLSNPKINMLTTTSTMTKNIVIKLSNGYVIDRGCKLTIIKGVPKDEEDSK